MNITLQHKKGDVTLAVALKTYACVLRLRQPPALHISDNNQW